jgi:hypothetical protein
MLKEAKCPQNASGIEHDQLLSANIKATSHPIVGVHRFSPDSKLKAEANELASNAVSCSMFHVPCGRSARLDVVGPKVLSSAPSRVNPTIAAT